MCIIIAKDKTNRLPSDSELRYSFQYNPDGAGFMYTDKGKVIIDKGYMNVETFMARYKTLCKKYNNFKDKCLVIHCRIGTAGSNTAKNTHPYPLTKSINKLHKTYVKTHLGIAHNGIISDFQPHGKLDINDTQNFIKTYLVRKYKEDNEFYTRRFERDIMEDITSSRLAFLDTNDNLYLVGNYVTESNLKFSNTHYKPYTYTYKYADYWYDYDSYEKDVYDRDKKESSVWSYKWNSDSKKYEEVK